MYDLQPREAYYTVARVARERGMPFGGHVQDVPNFTVVDASDSGARVIDHILGGMARFCLPSKKRSDSTLMESCQTVVDHFRRNNTWWVATLIATLNAIYDEEYWKRSLPIHAAVQDVRSALTGGVIPSGNWLRSAMPAPSHPPDSAGVLRIVARVGLPLLTGTDAMEDWQTADVPPGFGLHGELAIFVAEGLTPLAALQAATLNPAKMWHATDSLGTVAPGKLADLVLLNADPLADITNTTTIQAVVANGRYYNRAMLDSVFTGVLR